MDARKEVLFCDLANQLTPQSAINNENHYHAVFSLTDYSTWLKSPARRTFNNLIAIYN